MKVLNIILYTLILWYLLYQLINWLFIGMLTKLFPMITDQYVLGGTLGVAVITALLAVIKGESPLSISLEYKSKKDDN